MSDLGLLLRKAREQRGYTLDDIQEITKIRKRYLEAIETGDYKVLPGSFYVRAFVKTYAETVGLDAEEVLRLYHKELPKAQAPEAGAPEPSYIQPKSRRVQHNDRIGKVVVTSLMWLFPILIAVVIYVYYANNKPDTDKPAESTPPSITTETALPSSAATPTPTPTATPTPTPTPPQTTVTFREKKNSRYYFDVSPAGKHQLKITFPGGKSWVGVNENNSSGKSIYGKTPEQSEILTFELGETPLYVNLGFAKGAQIEIDGVAVDDEDVPGRRRFIFTVVDDTGQSPTPTP